MLSLYFHVVANKSYIVLDLMMSSIDMDEENIPWGKYRYVLEGLATGCYMEGSSERQNDRCSGSLSAQKLRFRVELPARCFVLSVAVKLPNAPETVLATLNDVKVERALSNGEYELVYSTASTSSEKKEDDTNSSKDHSKKDQHVQDANVFLETVNNDSPTAIDQTVPDNCKLGQSPKGLPRKKVIDVRRAADSLRLTLTDIDEVACVAHGKSCQKAGVGSEDDSDVDDFRTLGIVVVGYIRGQTPGANRIKVLLNSSTRMGLQFSKADRAEVDGLLGLAFLGSRRYLQAAELLQRASELITEVAVEDSQAGISTLDDLTWASELNLLSAHAYFEHMPMSNDGIIRLVLVAEAAKSKRHSRSSPRSLHELSSDYLDLRTELLIIQEDLLGVLVRFLTGSSSLAVKMASARMIEFISEQLGCAISKNISPILNHALLSYPKCVSFGARERAAAASFSYESMEDCLERLVDICCRLFPLTEHGVLQDLYENTLIPIFLDGYCESEYLHCSPDGDDSVDELMAAALAQTLRVTCLVLRVLGSDAKVPTSVLSRVLNILLCENRNPKTSLLLRRTALHTWDALCKALVCSASGSTIEAFSEHITVLHSYIPKLMTEISRPRFEYKEIEDEGDIEIEVIKEEYLLPDRTQEMRDIFHKRHTRTEIVDRHTLRRVFSLLHDLIHALRPTAKSEERFSEVAFGLQESLGRYIADLAMSSLIDVSYHEATVSGHGLEGANNLFEFGGINMQLIVSCQHLEELFRCYWAVVKLLPSATISDTVQSAPIMGVLCWAVSRMKHSAPPRGMLRLLHTIVKGLQDELNTPMYGLPDHQGTHHEITFLEILRCHLKWFAQSVYEEAFDVMDALNEAVAENLMAGDLILLIQGLGDQNEVMHNRTQVSLDLLVSIIVNRTPERPDLMMNSLKDQANSNFSKQRISNGFPKFNKSNNTGSFSRRNQNNSATPLQDPMIRSLYLHVVLSSCFDKFDGLARAAKQRAGPSYMGEKIDSFVEHAALSVRSLNECARSRGHREYVGAVLGDIFGTCLAMQDHGEGRVRLAGFEIFAASLDVLFLAQKSLGLIPPKQQAIRNGIDVGGSMSLAPTSFEDAGLITNLTSSSHQEKSSGSFALSRVTAADALNLNSGPSAHQANTNVSVLSENKVTEVTSVSNTDIEHTMSSSFVTGGSCSFQGEDALQSELLYEERGWQMLCAFITSSLAIGKYVDFIVQRACLEYLKGCILNALHGRSTGASVIAFEHIELLWDAVNRLVGSPWLALNDLAMWVLCAILNVAIYSSVMAKGRGATRQRSVQLHEFVKIQMFPRTEVFLQSRCREIRLWGMRLLEVYIKAQDLNRNVAHLVPSLSEGVHKSLDTIKKDWNVEVRDGLSVLLEAHHNSSKKKNCSQVASFTFQAQNFMSMKRHQLDDMEGSVAPRIELWFPPLPKQLDPEEMEMFCRSLEAFANSEVHGGEETDLIRPVDQPGDIEDDYEAEYEDDEGYEFETEEVSDPAENKTLYDGTTEAVHIKGEDINSLEHPFSEKASSALSEVGESNVEEETEAKRLPVPLKDVQTVSPDLHRENEGHAKYEENVKTIATTDGDSDEDHEFTVLRNEKRAYINSFLLSKASNEEAQNTQGKRMEDGIEDDDEVVDVTDEDDVLVDFETMSGDNTSSICLSDSSGSYLAKWSASSCVDASMGSVKHSLGRSNNSSSSDPKPELNPDLDERVQVLRRKGSFTYRTTPLTPLEDGVVPRLARRRSIDIASLATGIGTAAEGKSSYRDTQDLSPVSFGSRLSWRQSVKSSPRLLESCRKRKGSLEDNSFANEHTERKAQLKQGVFDFDTEKTAQRETTTPLACNDVIESKQGRSPKLQSRDLVVGEAFLSFSPNGSRIPRGVNLSDDGEEWVDTNSQPSSHLSPNANCGKLVVEHTSRSTRPCRSRLPRAPAFVKGGGHPKTMSTVLPMRTSTSTTDEDFMNPDDSFNSRVSEGTSIPIEYPTSVRGKHMRLRGRSNKSARVYKTEDKDDRSDKTHRYSKRDPFPFASRKDIFDLENSFYDNPDVDACSRILAHDDVRGEEKVIDDECKRQVSKSDVSDSFQGMIGVNEHDSSTQVNSETPGSSG